MIRFGIGLATAVGLIGILALTLLAFGLPVGDSMILLGEGAFGDRFGIARSLLAATPLLLAGLGVVIAWRAGMFNIGGEGQYIVGGLAGAWLAAGLTGRGSGLLTLGILAAGSMGGAAYGALAGWLQVRRGVQVVISTILLNFVAIQALSWAVSGPLQEPGRALPQTASLPREVMLPRFDPQTDLHAGILIALVAALVVHVFLFLTRAGFAMRLVGASPRVARLQQVKVGRVQIAAMAISGGLCGLAGAVQFTGVQRELSVSFSEQWGFIAIPVALLGMLHPIGVLVSGLYFGALMAGAKNLERFTPGAGAMVFVVQGVAVLAILALRTSLQRARIGEGASPST